MKKVLRRILVLACATVLCILPTSTAYASVPPSYVYEDDLQQYKYFEFKNQPFIINVGNIDRLENNENNGNWFVQAGQFLHFHVDFLLPGNYEFTIYNATTGQTIVSEQMYTDGSGLGFPISQTGNYMLLIKPVGSEAAIIEWFNVDID